MDDRYSSPPRARRVRTRHSSSDAGPQSASPFALHQRLGRQRFVRRSLLTACLLLTSHSVATGQFPDGAPRRLPAPEIAQAQLGVVRARAVSEPSDYAAAPTHGQWSEPRSIGSLASLPRHLPPITTANSQSARKPEPVIGASSISMHSTEIDWSSLEGTLAMQAALAGTIKEPFTPANSQPAPAAPPVYEIHINHPPQPLPPPVTIVNVPPTPVTQTVEDPKQLERQRIASMVSYNNLVARPVSVTRSTPRPMSDSLTTAQLMREAAGRLEEAERLLESRAYYAAREAAVEVLKNIATAQDIRSGGSQASDSLTAGLDAFREAGDFAGRFGDIDAERLIRMVASHRTPVLQNCDLSNMTALGAANTYLDYAREQLTTTAGGQPEAARALLVLGNSERTRSINPESLRDPIAITCVRAALSTKPDDHRLASELGYHAVRLGLLDEARWALEMSLSIQPTPEALANLVETHRLAGDIGTARQLAAKLETLQQDPAAQRAVEVMTVSPAVFASISPPVQSGEPIAPTPMPNWNTPTNPQTPQESLRPQGEQSVLDRMAGAVKGLWR